MQPCGGMDVSTHIFRRDLKASETLVDDATEAVRMLITLTELQDQGDETSSVMPRSALGSAKVILQSLSPSWYLTQTPARTSQNLCEVTCIQPKHLAIEVPDHD